MKIDNYKFKEFKPYIKNNLKHNIPNIQGKYNRMIIPSMK